MNQNGVVPGVHLTGVAPNLHAVKRALLLKQAEGAYYARLRGSRDMYYSQRPHAVFNQPMGRPTFNGGNSVFAGPQARPVPVLYSGGSKAGRMVDANTRRHLGYADGTSVADNARAPPGYEQNMYGHGSHGLVGGRMAGEGLLNRQQPGGLAAGGAMRGGMLPISPAQVAQKKAARLQHVNYVAQYHAQHPLVPDVGPENEGDYPGPPGMGPPGMGHPAYSWPTLHTTSTDTQTEQPRATMAGRDAWGGPTTAPDADQRAADHMRDDNDGTEAVVNPLTQTVTAVPGDNGDTYDDSQWAGPVLGDAGEFPDFLMGDNPHALERQFATDPEDMLNEYTGRAEAARFAEEPSEAEIRPNQYGLDQLFGDDDDEDYGAANDEALARRNLESFLNSDDADFTYDAPEDYAAGYNIPEGQETATMNNTATAPKIVNAEDVFGTNADPNKWQAVGNVDVPDPGLPLLPVSTSAAQQLTDDAVQHPAAVASNAEESDDDDSGVIPLPKTSTFFDENGQAIQNNTDSNPNPFPTAASSRFPAVPIDENSALDSNSDDGARAGDDADSVTSRNPHVRVFNDQLREKGVDPETFLAMVESLHNQGRDVDHPGVVNQIIDALQGSMDPLGQRVDHEHTHAAYDRLMETIPPRNTAPALSTSDAAAVDAVLHEGAAANDRAPLNAVAAETHVNDSSSLPPIYAQAASSGSSDVPFLTPAKPSTEPLFPPDVLNTLNQMIRAGVSPESPEMRDMVTQHLQGRLRSGFTPAATTTEAKTAAMPTSEAASSPESTTSASPDGPLIPASVLEKLHREARAAIAAKNGDTQVAVPATTPIASTPSTHADASTTAASTATAEHTPDTTTTVAPQAKPAGAAKANLTDRYENIDDDIDFRHKEPKLPPPPSPGTGNQTRTPLLDKLVERRIEATEKQVGTPLSADEKNKLRREVIDSLSPEHRRTATSAPSGKSTKARVKSASVGPHTGRLDFGTNRIDEEDETKSDEDDGTQDGEVKGSGLAGGGRFAGSKRLRGGAFPERDVVADHTDAIMRRVIARGGGGQPQLTWKSGPLPTMARKAPEPANARYV